jgi:hypothetical protein
MKLVEVGPLPPCLDGYHGELEAGVDALTGLDLFTCVECGAVFVQERLF